MNNNIEKIRDALAGALAGAVLSIIIFLLSMVNATLHLVGGLFTGNASFEAMSGNTFAAMIVFLMIIGAFLGYAVGYYLTQETTMKKSIQKWMKKYNR